MTRYEVFVNRYGVGIGLGQWIEVEADSAREAKLKAAQSIGCHVSVVKKVRPLNECP